MFFLRFPARPLRLRVPCVTGTSLASNPRLLRVCPACQWEDALSGPVDGSFLALESLL